MVADPAASAAVLGQTPCTEPRLTGCQQRRGPPRQAGCSARGALPFPGPAFVAAIAYVDPESFATNVVGGARYGYLLLWVLIAANVMAMLIRYLSAKLGIATSKNLPELCREQFPLRCPGCGGYRPNCFACDRPGQRLHEVDSTEDLGDWLADGLYVDAVRTLGEKPILHIGQAR